MIVKILTFPLRLVFFILCWIIRIVLMILGLFIMFLSNFMGKLLTLFGMVISLGALLMTVYTISKAKKGEPVRDDIITCVLSWVVSFAIFMLPILGEVIGDLFVGAGFSITSFAGEVLLLDF